MRPSEQRHDRQLERIPVPLCREVAGQNRADFGGRPLCQRIERALSHNGIGVVEGRSDRMPILLRDFDHPALRTFPPIDYFPTDEKLRVEARLQRYAQPRIVRVDTVIEGLDYNPSSPGVLRFDIGGQSFELEVYDAGDEYLLVFGDATSGRDTYPAGRFLYAEKPGNDGTVLLDFNTAQNPPCAFNEFATCPVASPRNRLAVRIPAGERYDPSGH